MSSVERSVYTSTPSLDVSFLFLSQFQKFYSKVQMIYSKFYMQKRGVAVKTTEKQSKKKEKMIWR